MAVLYAFAGLPGVGKTTLAIALAQRTGATYLRVDAVEQGLRDTCGLHIHAEGYELAAYMATDCLKQGLSVICDSCNTVAASRVGWQQAADAAGAACFNIEVICSDAEEHRRRVEARTSSLPGLIVPTWSAVQAREYEPWSVPVIGIDTAGTSLQACRETLFASLGV